MIDFPLVNHREWYVIVLSFNFKLHTLLFSSVKLNSSNINLNILFKYIKLLILQIEASQ